MTGTVRTLLLLRHAKSDYPDGVTDHDRPLAPRGVREGALAGDWIRAHVPPVDAVLCSTAQRTRQTLERTGIDAPVRYAARVYDATPGIVLDEINSAEAHFGADPATLLVVGHEPVMSSLALGLAGDSDSEAARQIAAKFPTSSVAVLRTETPWAGLELGGAELVAFHTAR
ncbi:histidine phosphatase family protein [Mycobacterium sp. SMC-4]|uniref:SixA phosphatase family protein n=1 Tax=Mycobacterium sp. SMC-4 TaxID=2857059 RepID=UPI0021B21AB4|nr:histidine phosphatase family protein [Mycobacterium sp. SMC-4]UXA16784.1 histidine phosphatase family protein [Mycobacterium sp. SMC-4]